MVADNQIHDVHQAGEDQEKHQICKAGGAEGGDNQVQAGPCCHQSDQQHRAGGLGRIAPAFGHGRNQAEQDEADRQEIVDTRQADFIGDGRSGHIGGQHNVQGGRIKVEASNFHGSLRVLFCKQR